jgi:hypothetical protein
MAWDQGESMIYPTVPLPNHRDLLPLGFFAGEKTFRTKLALLSSHVFMGTVLIVNQHLQKTEGRGSDAR